MPFEGEGQPSGQKGGCAASVKALAPAVLGELSGEVKRLLPVGTAVAVDFEMVEKSLKTSALELTARLVAQHLNADVTDGEEPELPCVCGNQAQYVERRRKTFMTALGEMTLKRAYYLCKSCRTGFCPRDRELGMAHGSESPAVMRMAGLAAGQLSFARSSTLLRELADLRLNAKRVERVAERLGDEIFEDEQQVIDVEPCAADTMYLGVDGTGIPVRPSETAGRKGKQADGSAKTREVKLVAVWTAQSRHKETGLPMRDVGSVTYSAAIESAACNDRDKLPSVFARRVDREAWRRDFYQPDRRQVVIGDGAEWIWNLSNELFANPVEILDLYHAKEHMWKVAKAVFSSDSDLAPQWANNRCDELDKGDIDAVVWALKQHAPQHEKASQCLQYVRNNKQRMRYKKFREMGLCVGSGVLEGGCKSVIGARLKNSGMFWSVDGANAIIALRCSIESNRFDDFWERRAEQN